MLKTRGPEPHRELREMLEDRRREIQEKLRSLREAVPADAKNVKDAEERSLDDLIADLDIALMEMKAASLASIDDALSSLRRGAYGTCVACGREIAPARLLALPFAARCLSCQEAEEGRDTAARSGRPRVPGPPGAEGREESRESDVPFL